MGMCYTNKFKQLNGKSHTINEINFKKNKNKIYLFGIIHIFATKNNTFLHVTDLSGKETIFKTSSNIKSKTIKDEKTIYSTMLASEDLVNASKKFGINAYHIKIRARGGNRSQLLGMGAHIALKVFIQLGLSIGRIEDVTPIPTNGTRKKGGRRGRRV